MLKLYSYWRSTAAYRVRIGLNLKQLEHEIVSVDLRPPVSEQRGGAYLARNPQGLVPTLVDGERIISQSLAILEYLEEIHPEPALLPRDPQQRALARQIALAVACDIHPLNNLRVPMWLKQQYGVSETQTVQWMHHWMAEGFRALEDLLAGHGRRGPFALGDTVGLADIFIVAQLYNAHRFELPLEGYPTLRAIEAACLPLTAFHRALPENQPDAVK